LGLLAKLVQVFDISQRIKWALFAKYSVKTDRQEALLKLFALDALVMIAASGKTILVCYIT
jgi:hypothetical protein